jgi:hypothetical protein
MKPELRVGMCLKWKANPGDPVHSYKMLLAEEKPDRHNPSFRALEVSDVPETPSISIGRFTSSWDNWYHWEPCTQSEFDAARLRVLTTMDNLVQHAR